MGTEEKLYKKIQQAAQNSEQKDFPGMENIWARVENKLETQTLKQEKHLWKKIAVAASIVLVGTLAFFMLQPKENIIIPENIVTAIDTARNNIPTPESANGFVNTNPVIKKDAEQILQQQITIQNNIVINDTINYKSDKQVIFSTPMAVKEIKSKENVSSDLKNDTSNAASLNNQGYFAKGKRYDVTTFVAEEVTQDFDKKVSNDDLILIDGKLSKKRAKDIANGEYETITELKNPLYYINNVAYSEEELYGENPTSSYAPLSKQKINTIVILLPEKAIPIYGERGKNGVVIITIKE
ncbi:hypothetical protein ACFSX9_12230 [Flavobacterium ardleyense]|uniref:Uncharacterized protein n=1 Tax=Flavobacterium ardleyense TaxID=2038737 RepID=A0ABW5ZBK8_9FLAO